jgi:hypothetical protein
MATNASRLGSLAKPREGSSAEESLQIGVSRPALPLDDLPTPEEVFKVKTLGRAEVFKFVLGPSMIALGASIGSGEWLLGHAFGNMVYRDWLLIITAANFFNMGCSFSYGDHDVPRLLSHSPGKAFGYPLLCS